MLHTVANRQYIHSFVLWLAGSLVPCHVLLVLQLLALRAQLLLSDADIELPLLLLSGLVAVLLDEVSPQLLLALLQALAAFHGAL